MLLADDFDKIPTSWSADGKLLLYTAQGSNSRTGSDLWALPLSPERPGAALKPFLVLQTTFNEAAAQFSPDGRWILYTSNESHRNELYVTPFPLPSSGPAGKRQISAGGGLRPRWREDGKEIFYVGPPQLLMSADVAIKAGTVEIGAVRSLFNIASGPTFDVSADGQRFLSLAPPEEKSAQPLTLIQNWAAALRSR